MEGLNMKKNHPSLPSNYVTIVDLQQRRLKQQQDKEEKEQQPQTQNLKQQEPHRRADPPPVVIRTYGTAHRNHRAKQYGSKDRNDSGGVRDQTADLNNKGNESKKTKKINVKRNPNLKQERGTSQQGSRISETKAKKSTTESKSNEEKEEKNDDATVDKVEQKFGGLSMNTENGKKSWGFKRVNEGFRQSQRKDGFRQYQSQRNGFSQFRSKNYEEQKQSGNKMVWVRKDCNVGGEIVET